MKQIPILYVHSKTPDVAAQIRASVQSEFNVIYFESRTDLQDALTSKPPNILVFYMDGLVTSDFTFISQCGSQSPTSARLLLSSQIRSIQIEAAIKSETIHRFLLWPLSKDLLFHPILECSKLNKILETNLGLQKISYTDPLTGISNRRYFDEQAALEFERAARHSRCLGLVIVDLDYFKKINDIHGHLQGDETLKRVAEVLNQSVRSIDVLARYGGDEFALLLPDTGLMDSMMVGDRLRKKIQNIDFGFSPVTSSMGVAATPESANDLKDLIAKADKGLRFAKERGKNIVAAFSAEGRMITP